MKKARLTSPIPFALFAALLILSSCGTLEVESRWADNAISVDGRLDDWQGRLHDIEDMNVSFGLQNDGRFLYLALRAADPRVMGQIMRSGLIVWFDPSGGKGRIWGVRYPLARDWSDFQGLPGRGEEDRKRSRDAAREQLEEAEVIGPGRDEKARFKIGEIPGLKLAVVRSPGLFVYELSVPLEKAENAPFAAAAKPGAFVGLGIDTPKLDFVVPGRGMGGPGMGGMGPAGMGRGYPGRGGVLVGRGLRGAEPLKLELKVRLAEEPRRP
ncbi:MAG: hypothetical protein FJY82_03210 [Candidatus Aminicenantes bacterium]|nr:hypothetical protein [Candidatus Aminicenantes bacterium]